MPCAWRTHLRHTLIFGSRHHSLVLLSLVLATWRIRLFNSSRPAILSETDSTFLPIKPSRLNRGQKKTTETKLLVNAFLTKNDPTLLLRFLPRSTVTDVLRTFHDHGDEILARGFPAFGRLRHRRWSHPQRSSRLLPHLASQLISTSRNSSPSIPAALSELVSKQYSTPEPAWLDPSGQHDVSAAQRGVSSVTRRVASYAVCSAAPFINPVPA